MSTVLTPSKRPDDSDIAVQNGKEKKQKVKSLNSPNETSKSSLDGILLRILCPVSKMECLFGAGDALSSQIHQETGALVKVEESIPGFDERVVSIIYPDEKTEMNTEQAKEEQNKESSNVEGSDDTDESSGGDKDKISVPAQLKSSRTPSVQRAMLIIFERMIEAEPEPEGEPDTGPETDGDLQRNKKSATCIMRLLVLSSQVGSLLGKSGSVIKQMSNESGAQIQILPRDKLPTCASAGDDLVQVTGEVEVVKKALLLVSEQLLENNLQSNESNPTNISGRSSNPSNHPPLRQDHPSSRHSHTATARGAPRDFHEGGIPGRMKPFPDITFRLLCNNDMVGCVIGKGGTIIKTLEQETGCEIKVLEATSELEERIIVISGPVHPNDRISAPQDGVVRVQTRIFRALPEDKEKPLVARLLVSSNQIGCLLGKGGSVIAEMRKSSGAYIRILGKEQVPKCASENEEVVQVNGDYEVVKEALLQITSRLIHHFFKDIFPSTDYPPHPPFMDQVPPFPARMGRREFSPPFHSLHNFDGMTHMGGPLPHGGFHPHDERPTSFHNMHRPGMPHSLTDRNPWGRQGFMETGAQMGLPYFAAPHGRMGFNGVSSQPIITSTTIEVIVPRSVVPEIYGEDGAHLKQIIEFSDAKIKINAPKPGAKETVITITGTPEQSNAAQSLIQAFVMLEKESKS